MNYAKQRQMAAKLLPELRRVIRDGDNCFQDIMAAAKPYREKILAMWRPDWPQEWAYCWAYHIGDRKLMRDRVTEPEWVFWWALSIGDRRIMRSRMRGSVWVGLWVDKIGDEDYFLKKFPEWNTKP